jgi:ATP-binding protein involved in chromosome partitioning
MPPAPESTITPATDGLDAVADIILVMSGKGGVGKSTVSANLAAALRDAGRRVGLLDIDLHGPSIPTLLGIEDASVGSDGRAILPVETAGLRVMSIGFLLAGADSAVIWRGPRKAAAINQFLTETAWGALDHLIVDLPPGTGDEALAIAQAVPGRASAVVVAAPQRLAAMDVRKSLTFCAQLQIPVRGVIENMRGFVCPDCGTITDVFGHGAGEELAQATGVPFLGSIPLDPAVVVSGERGRPFLSPDADGPTAACFRAVVAPLIAQANERVRATFDNSAPVCTETCTATCTGPCEQIQDTAAREGACDHHPTSPTPDPLEDSSMTACSGRIAIPIADGKLCQHFGHCQQFALIDVRDGAIIATTHADPPPHEPGVLPAWLAEQGATTIIAGGMGQRAQGLFTQRGIQVITGATPDTPEAIVTAHCAGTLATGANACDH